MSAPRTKKAAPAPLRLFKVLTADGHSAYITAYAWSLPEQAADGSWTPGAWHEEPPEVFDRGHGLHVSPSPSHYTPRSSCITYECEAEGYREDPQTSHHVVALRVRLLRPVSAEEAERASHEWDSGKWARIALADQKERLDRARTAARSAKANQDAARAAGVESPALTAFRLLVEVTPTESWREVNGCRYDALRYAIKWLRFDPADVTTIYREFGGAHWFGAGSGTDEHLYELAIEQGNKSACVAWEHYFGRKPWWRSAKGGTRERIHVGTQIRVGGVWHRITSFRADYLNAVRESDGRVVKLTREQIEPKRARAEEAEVAA